MKHLAVLITLGFASLSPVYAATVSDAQADRLKAQVQGLIDQKSATLKASGITLVQTGALTVEPVSTYYAVTTPEFKLKFPDNSQRVIGMLAINAIPTDASDIYKMAIAIPTPMPHLNAQGEVTGTLDIGQQTMSGLYDFSIQNFTELSATYKDITVRENTGLKLDIPSVVIRSKLTNNGQGLLSGPTQVTLQGLQYVSNTGDKTSLKSLDMRLNTELFDTAAATLFQAGLTQHLLAAPDDKKTRNDMGLGYLLRAADALEININATGFSTDIRLKNADAPTALKAASATIRIEGSQLKSGNGQLSFTQSVEGIDTPNQPALMPTRMGITLTAQNLPAIDHTQTNILDVIKSKGSLVTLKQFHIDAADYGINSTSTLNFDDKAAFGVVADTQIQIRGLESAMQKLMQNTDKAKIPPFMMGVLGVIQMTGESKPDAQGRPVLHYALKVDKDGGVTLNNAPLMQAQTAKKAPAKTAPKAP